MRSGIPSLLKYPDRRSSSDVEQIDALLAQRLTAANHVPVGRRLGLEHEYAVFEDARQVDFRDVIHEAEVDGLPLHPTNPDFYLTRSGIALMADGIVAEVASPPERLAPGFTGAIEGWAAGGRAQLEKVLPSAMTLEPGSTHISVETDSSLNDSLCNLYTRTFAPGLMLLMDNIDSPGMLFRPRPGRAELCGEFTDGVRLRAAAAYAAGSVLALEQRLRGESADLPPILDVAVEPGRQRYGWYVDRKAFGPDLYKIGRQTLLKSGHGTITAQSQLEASWRIAREALKHAALKADLAAADDLVAGRLPLPCELLDLPVPSRNGHLPATSGFSDVVSIRRGDLILEPVSATWDYVAYTVSDGENFAVVNVPETHLVAFADLVRRGDLDDLLQAYLDAPSGQLLQSHGQTIRPGFFDAIRVSNAMMPPDRYGIGGGQIARGRPGKVFLPWPPDDGGGGGIPWIPSGWRPRNWLPIGIGTGLIVTIVTTLIVFGGGGDSGVADQPTVVAQAPSPTLPAVALPPTATQVVALPPTETPAAALPPTATATTAVQLPTATPVPPTPAPPTTQTIETTSTNTLISYSASCPQIFIDNNPPIGTIFDNVGTWTMTRTSATAATIQTAGGFNGTLDIPSRTMIGDRFQGGVHYHKVLVWSEDFTSASGTTEIITTISGVDCIMTFEEKVNTLTPWLF